MWQTQMDALSQHFRVITPDVFGFGGSQPPQPWTMPDMGDALLALLDQLRIEKCALGGLSMGGYISLPFVLAHPERVSRLILAHTRARADLDNETIARNAMIATLRKEGNYTLPDKMLPRLLAVSTTEDIRRGVRDSIERASASACIHAVTAMRDRVDQTANLGRITCPTLVITGGSDPIIKVEDSESLAAAFPAGEIRVIEGTAHLSNLENPAAFNQTVEEFLAPLL